MWEFLGQVLETGGFVALAFVVLITIGGLIVRSVWQDNKALRLELSQLNDKINNIQEKRVDETKQVIEQVLTHASNVDRAVEKLDKTLDVVVAGLRGR